MFVSTQGQSNEFMGAGQGRLVNLSNTNSENLGATSSLIASGQLAPGDIIGVVAPDTPGQPEDIEVNLVEPLTQGGCLSLM